MSDGITRLPFGVCIVRSTQTVVGDSRLNYSVAIARETVGAQQLAMSLVSVPPGGTARPHYHLAGETIIHILSGRAETRFGQHLGQSVVNGPGDFIYIAANVPHAPRNLSDHETGLAINARSDPSVQEPVVPIEPSVTLKVNWHDQSVVTVAARTLTLAPGERLQEFGATGQTVGARGLCMLRLALAPYACTLPHAHPASEAGVYFLQGEIETKFGEQLQHSVINTPGEFLFLPVGVKHQLSNCSAEQALLVLARTDADEEKDTMTYE